MKLRSVAYFISGALGLIAGLGLIYYPQRVQANLYKTVSSTLLLHQLHPEQTQLRGRSLSASFKISKENSTADKKRIESVLNSIPGVEITHIEWIINEKARDHATVPEDESQQKTRHSNAATKLQTLVIHFDYKKTEMLWASQKDFVALVDLLRDQENLSVEILGYADDIGPNPYNLALSLQRAEFIKNLLVQSGISNERLIARGLGEPKNASLKIENQNEQNKDATERRLLRKVEFRLAGSQESELSS